MKSIRSRALRSRIRRETPSQECLFQVASQVSKKAIGSDCLVPNLQIYQPKLKNSNFNIDIINFTIDKINESPIILFEIRE